jgi:Molecular chaperone (small heat shock protein)
MADAFDDFDRIVESFLRPTYARSVNFQPSCDISESKDHYLVSFDMPGVKKEDIKIDVQENNLIISGERQREMKEQNQEGAFYNERSYGKFERTFVMPKSVDVERIEAHYENGVLNVALPKAETAKPRTIQIQSGPDGGLFNRLLSSKKENA